VRRHHLIEIKGIKELTLSISSTPHHATLPPINHSIERNHGSQIVSMRVLQQNQREGGHHANGLARRLMTRSGQAGPATRSHRTDRNYAVPTLSQTFTDTEPPT